MFTSLFYFCLSVLQPHTSFSSFFIFFLFWGHGQIFCFINQMGSARLSRWARSGPHRSLDPAHMWPQSSHVPNGQPSPNLAKCQWHGLGLSPIQPQPVGSSAGWIQEFHGLDFVHRLKRIPGLTYTLVVFIHDFFKESSKLHWVKLNWFTYLLFVWYLYRSLQSWLYRYTFVISPFPELSFTYALISLI